MSYFKKEKQISKDEFVFGVHPVLETLKAGKEIDRILMQKDANAASMAEISQLAKDLKVPVVKVPIEKLNRVTKKNHQGVICFVSSVVYASLDNVVEACFSKGEMPFLLILDRITDVRNMGAIARTAECLGVHAIVIPSKGSAQLNSDAVKTSAGALNYIPICREEYLKKTITFLKESGIRVVGCTEKASKPLFDGDLTGPIAVIMGSEEDGISPEYLKLCDDNVKIPLTGKVESLNVSVAAGMMLYEVNRQRG